MLRNDAEFSLPNPSADSDVRIDTTPDVAEMDAICFQSNAWKAVFKVVRETPVEAAALIARSKASFQKHNLNTYSD